MAQQARLEIVVTSTGVKGAGKELQELTAYSKETAKQQKDLAAVFAEMAAAEEKAAQKAAAAAAKQAEATEKAAQKAAAAAEREAAKAAATAERESARQARQLARENEQWNDAYQKAIARNERRAASAEKAAKREEEAWNNAIQRAKAGLDGVLPIRPSLQRIEAKLNESSGHSESGMAGIFAGGKEGAVSALGLGALAGGAASAAAAAVETVIEKVHGLSEAVIENLIEDDKLVARLGGVTDSAEAASETFEDLQTQTFGKLPSKIDEVANAFIQLGNNGLQNGQSALKAYSNIAAQTGSSLSNVTSAVQQATLGNYRSLREFGIKVKEEGDSLQVTFRGQTETIAGGADAIEQYMQRLGTVQFAGAVERQMDTIGGTVKKTQDAWERFINAVGDSSLGSLIQSSVGASIGIIDAMTASVDALFDKAHKGMRELEEDKKRITEQEKLDKEMMSWADPTASKTETARLAQVLHDSAQSSADKALAQYAKNAALIDKLESLGETQVGDMTLQEARNELARQFQRDNGGFATKTEYTPKIGTGTQTNEAAYAQMVRTQQQTELEAVHESLRKKEESAEVLYRKNKEILERSAGDQTEYLRANETEYTLHLATVAELKEKKAKEDEKKEIELQKRLLAIGTGPETSFQVTERKYAGQRFDLASALHEKLTADTDSPFASATREDAERTYAEKSVAIERARAREIAQINRDLVQQSLQNSQAIFGGLAEAMKNAHGEQSKEYRMMFAAQKAFAIATAEVAMFTDMAKANAAGFPANVPLYLKAAADGMQIISQLSSLSYSGAYDSGGNIPAGSFGLVAEERPELLTSPTLVRGPASVVGGRATAEMLGGSAQPLSFRFVNAYDGGEAVKGYLGSTDGEQVLVNFVKRNGSLIRTVVR